jgi:hypothetical protein
MSIFDPQRAIDQVGRRQDVGGNKALSQGAA